MDPAADLHERNLGSTFDAADTDRDGYITEDDVLAVGRRALDGFGVGDAGLRAEISGLYQSLWLRLRADCDSDGDGFIEAGEFARMFTSQGVDERVVQAAFERLDADADGKISVAAFSDA